MFGSTIFGSTMFVSSYIASVSTSLNNVLKKHFVGVWCVHMSAELNPEVKTIWLAPKYQYIFSVGSDLKSKHSCIFYMGAPHCLIYSVKCWLVFLLLTACTAVLCFRTEGNLETFSKRALGVYLCWTFCAQVACIFSIDIQKWVYVLMGLQICWCVIFDP